MARLAAPLVVLPDEKETDDHRAEGNPDDRREELLANHPEERAERPDGNAVRDPDQDPAKNEEPCHGDDERLLYRPRTC